MRRQMHEVKTFSKNERFTIQMGRRSCQGFPTQNGMTQAIPFCSPSLRSGDAPLRCCRAEHARRPGEGQGSEHDHQA